VSHGCWKINNVYLKIINHSYIDYIILGVQFDKRKEADGPALFSFDTSKCITVHTAGMVHIIHMQLKVSSRVQY
jgi:hypothetical protein